MMHMGQMFPGFGMLFGWLWLLIPLVAIFFGWRLLRALTTRRQRGYEKFAPDNMKGRDSSIQNQILKLAFNNRGVLTVTDVVMGTGLSIKDAEEALNGMVDGYRVNMQVKDTGIIVYEFIEIMNREMKDTR